MWFWLMIRYSSDIRLKLMRKTARISFIYVVSISFNHSYSSPFHCFFILTSTFFPNLPYLSFSLSLFVTLFLSSSNLVHALPLLTCMREISGSNLGARDTQYLELFLSFPQFLQSNVGIVLVLWNTPRPLPSTSFLIIRESIYSSMLQNMGYWLRIK
jgi:hypothetical protein